MTPSERKPMVLVIAGPNGSGKSTITQFFDIVGTYTNADDVVKTTGMSVIDAAKFVDEKRYESINNKQDFTFETVLSSQYKLDILKKAKKVINLSKKGKRVTKTDAYAIYCDLKSTT